MMRFGILPSALVGVLLVANGAAAQVFIKAPFVRVQTGGPGGGVYVRAPFVTVNIPPAYPAYYSPIPAYAIPAAPAPATDPALPELPQPQPLPQGKEESYIIPPNPQPASGATTVASRAVMSHYEFAKAFVPIPGRQQVTLIHSRNHKPVDVAFNLPPGNPKVITRAHGIIFDYGNAEVEIRFALFGKVKVYYN